MAVVQERTIPPSRIAMVYHILLVSVAAWGHIRPLLALAVRLALERDDTVLTVLVAPSLLDKSFLDVQLQVSHNQSVAKRIRILSASPMGFNVPLFDDTGKSAEAYSAIYKRLVACESITCAVKGTVFDVLPPPVAIIMNFFALGELRATRAITGDKVPVTAVIASAAGAVIQLFGPESMGGFGNLGVKIDAEATRTGRNPVEVGEEMYYSVNGTVKKAPGMPDMYDYELFPQKMRPFGALSSISRAGYQFLEGSDGLILTTSKAYELSGSLEALRACRTAMNQETFAIGPLLPPEYSSGHISDRGDTNLAAFMSDMLKKHGERSLIFMSFGTGVWPLSLDYVEEVIDCMIERNLPFIFCHASPIAEVPPELVAKVELSGLGYLTKWAPQHYVLTHPVTGWYLTHCGWGGVTEALGAGVPMIAWPFMADQPQNAAHVSENIKAAIELVEVRTGENGLKPLCRNGKAAKGTRAAVRAEFMGVLDDIHGVKGAELRKAAESMRSQFAKTWESGGDARKELQAFLRRYVLRD